MNLFLVILLCVLNFGIGYWIKPQSVTYDWGQKFYAITTEVDGKISEGKSYLKIYSEGGYDMDRYELPYLHTLCAYFETKQELGPHDCKCSINGPHKRYKPGDLQKYLDKKAKERGEQ